MLPRTQHATFTTTLPSNGKKARYRLMTAREEKILLMAKETAEPSDILSAILQVVRNCLVDEPLQPLSIFDLEWLFIQIRSVSVAAISDQSYIDNEDGLQYDFQIDLTKVVVKYPEPKPDQKIQVGDDIFMELRWPPAELYADARLISAPGAEAFERLLASCIDQIYDAENVYDPKSETQDEIVEWIQDLPLDAYEKAQSFLSSVPHVFYELKYTNSKGDERTITLTSLSDFFTFA